MILSILALAQAAAAPAADQYAQCVALAQSDPAKAIEQANAWRIGGGGIDSRQCLGLAYAALARWAPAAVAFEQAAQEADIAKDGRSAALWVQAGNARLAGGEAKAAKLAFDAALARGTLAGMDRGEALLDRARALVALNDPAAARADLDKALELAPEDPLAWLLSATLARRQNQLDRAAKDIAEAAKRSPDDASVALEAGTIAMRQGAPGAARVAWEAAIKAQPGSAAALAAAENLKQLDQTH